MCSKTLRSFLHGYARSVRLIPDFSRNNQEADWLNIGNDLHCAMDKYKAKKEPRLGQLHSADNGQRQALRKK